MDKLSNGLTPFGSQLPSNRRQLWIWIPRSPFPRFRLSSISYFIHFLSAVFVPIKTTVTEVPCSCDAIQSLIAWSPFLCTSSHFAASMKSDVSIALLVTTLLFLTCPALIASLL